MQAGLNGMVARNIHLLTINRSFASPVKMGLALSFKKKSQKNRKIRLLIKYKYLSLQQ